MGSHIGECKRCKKIGILNRQTTGAWCCACQEEWEGVPKLLRRVVTTPAWTLKEGTELIQRIHPTFFQYGYNLHLGGGVLCRGYSEHDLDVIAIRRPQILEPFILPCLAAVTELGFVYTEQREMPFRWMYRYTKGAQQLDLIFIELLGDPPQLKPYYKTGYNPRTDTWGAAHLAELKQIRDRLAPL